MTKKIRTNSNKNSQQDLRRAQQRPSLTQTWKIETIIIITVTLSLSLLSASPSKQFIASANVTDSDYFESASLTWHTPHIYEEQEQQWWCRSSRLESHHRQESPWKQAIDKVNYNDSITWGRGRQREPWRGRRRGAREGLPGRRSSVVDQLWTWDILTVINDANEEDTDHDDDEEESEEDHHHHRHHYLVRKRVRMILTGIIGISRRAILAFGTPLINH